MRPIVIEEFAKTDAAQPPVQGGIVFAGSSSIRLWTSLAEEFPALPVLNRGFGGSQLPEVMAFADRIILPYRPREVVVYCGANDIAAGRTPEQVIADFKTLVKTIHAALPEARVMFISIAPTHMLGEDGLPKPDIFVDDRLHMNEKGHAIWKEVVGVSPSVRCWVPGAGRWVPGAGCRV